MDETITFLSKWFLFNIAWYLFMGSNVTGFYKLFKRSLFRLLFDDLIRIL